MRAINHAMTGALIGLVSGEPVVAIPAALASHFVLDAIPHHGSKRPDPVALRSKWFAAALIADALLCGLLVLVLATDRPAYWQLAAVCAFVAASPDFLFIKRYARALSKQSANLPRFVQWTRDIQWFQRPVGALVEAAWFVAGLICLRVFI